MRITVQLFAAVAERLGTDRLTLEPDALAAGLPAGTPPADAGQADAVPAVGRPPAGRLTAGRLKEAIATLYPEVAPMVRSCYVARNFVYAADDEPIASDDELALIPPVSGGLPDVPDGPTEMQKAAVTPGQPVLTDRPIDVAAVAAAVADPDCGATVLFVGTTREHTEGKRTLRLEYEAYRPMALRAMQDIVDRISQKWPESRSALVHRLGVVGIGEASVAIAVSAPHRDDAFAACRFAIERLKRTVPIWKKEIREDGREWKGDWSGSWNPTGEESDA